MNQSNPPDGRPASLRNVYAALANVTDRLAEEEEDDLNRMQREREAKRLRELARKEPPPTR